MMIYKPDQPRFCKRNIIGVYVRSQTVMSHAYHHDFAREHYIYLPGWTQQQYLLCRYSFVGDKVFSQLMTLCDVCANCQDRWSYYNIVRYWILLLFKLRGTGYPDYYGRIMMPVYRCKPNTDNYHQILGGEDFKKTVGRQVDDEKYFWRTIVTNDSFSCKRHLLQNTCFGFSTASKENLLIIRRTLNFMEINRKIKNLPIKCSTETSLFGVYWWGWLGGSSVGL